MKKILVILAIIQIFILGCSKEKAEIKIPIITGVGIQTITKSMTDQFYETSATVQSKNSSIISSMIMGKVTSLRVREGDRVSGGQLLLTIDARDTAQKAAAAQAGINEALKAVEAADQNRKLVNTTYQRYKNLFNENAMTRQEIDQITTQRRVADIEYQRALESVNRAKAGLGEIGVYQSYSRVTAPFSGVITQRNIDLGSIAVPGQPLLTIENGSNLEITANINESLADKVYTGMPVYLEDGNKNITSRIIKVIPKIDPSTRTFKAKIAANGAGFNNGQYLKAKIPVDKKLAVFVTKFAIVQKGQLTGVYVVDDNNIISYRLVRTGKSLGESVEILSGLNTGDKVITSGIEKAVDGGEVR